MKLHGLTPMVFSRQENSSLRSSYLPVGRQVFYAVTKTEHAKFLTPILQIIMTYDHNYCDHNYIERLSLIWYHTPLCSIF